MAQFRPAPLEKRTYKVKNPVTRFFCPLCRTERAFTIGPRLGAKNYLQISMVTLVTTALFFPLWEWGGVFSFFVYFAAFEFARRSLFRKQVPCPHCGFDASWYKRDVKVARTKVKDFWAAQGQNKQGAEGVSNAVSNS